MSRSPQLSWRQEEASAHLIAADRPLGRFIQSLGARRMVIRRGFTIFESLMRSIIYQQLAGSAAAAILERVKLTLTGDVGLYPSPEQLLAASEERLRSAGLSRNKLLALKDLAAKTLDGTVPALRRINRMDDAEIIERLTAIRGIGVWTVEMLLIFRLGRPDVLPLADYGVRRGFAVVFGKKDLPTTGELAKRGERWRPYRSLASWYLWRAAEK